MTLNITLLTERTIYQSADLRLTNSDTGEVVSDASTKLVTVQYGEWDGFVSYTGIGRWQGRDTSEFIVEWLTGLHDATSGDVATQIRDKGSEWLRMIESAARRHRHTFILAAFEVGRPHIAVISNFQDCFGRNDATPGPSLTISTVEFRALPRIVITGQRSAVSRQSRRRLEHLVRNGPDDPARVRRMLADINAEAADSSEARNTISRECSVVSFRADGQGVSDARGPVDIRALATGTPLPDWRELTRLLGFGPGLVVGSTFGSSKPRMPYAPCQPQIIIPADSAGYTIREVSHEDFASCRALDVNDAGVVLGDGNLHDRPGDYALWTTPSDGAPEPCGFMGKPGGINNSGEVAAEARMDDGSVHAVRWRGATPVDLGCYRGKDSSGAAINTDGTVAGWVCIDPADRGQGNSRPAAWFKVELSVLEDFGCDWGRSVDVNDEGTVLVVGYLGTQCRAILWNPIDGTTDVIAGGTGIYPSAISADGAVLGTAGDREGNSIAFWAESGKTWQRFDTPAGFYATGMNDAGEVAGAVVRDGYEQPWLRRVSGEIVWLPYFAHHGCRPSAVNASGVIVGTAQTDHGTHALIWTP